MEKIAKELGAERRVKVTVPDGPRVVRRRRGNDFSQNFERALEPARSDEVDVVVHGGDLLYLSKPTAVLQSACSG
jgi:hypothetical protein